MKRLWQSKCLSKCSAAKLREQVFEDTEGFAIVLMFTRKHRVGGLVLSVAGFPPGTQKLGAWDSGNSNSCTGFG